MADFSRQRGDKLVWSWALLPPLDSTPSTMKPRGRDSGTKHVHRWAERIVGNRPMVVPDPQDGREGAVPLEDG